MKKTIVFLGMVCMATTALAFGGGSSGQSSTRYNRHNPGVDNFGVHIHPDNPPLDIRFYDIKNDENARPCQEGANVYCCKEGYVVDVATSKCVPCPAGSVATLDENFKCTVCKETEHPNADKTACIVPADGITNQEECEKSGYKWCSGNNTCIDDTESCQCAGEQPACQKCDTTTGEWVADEECLCEADYNVWDTSEQQCCPYGFWREYKNIEEDGAACCDYYSYYTNQPSEDCCHAITYYARWDEDNQRCCSAGVNDGNFGLDVYGHKTTEDCCNFVGGGWDSEMQNCCPRDAWVEDVQACCWGPTSYFTNNLTENCCAGVSGKWDEDKKLCCFTGEYDFGYDAYEYELTEACCNVVGGNWSNGDCTPKISQSCAGAQPACQKCEDGEWVADTEKNGQMCELSGNAQGTCVTGECCPANRLNGDTCCDANFTTGEDGCVQACDENDFLSPGAGYCCVTQGEGVGYLAYFPLFVKAEKEYVLDPSCGGCPDSGTYVEVNGAGYCCKNGYSYDIQAGQYQNYNPGICGCPYSESDSNVYRFEDSTSPSGYLCCLNDNGGWMPWSYYENPDYDTQKGDGYHLNTEDAMQLSFGCKMLSQQ